MKKKFLLYGMNYLVLFICIMGFWGGAMLELMCIPMIQLVLTCTNFSYSINWKQLFLLELHLWIASISGIIASTWLYYHLISSDSETIMVGIAECQIDTIYVTVLGILAVGVKLIFILTCQKKE